MEVMKVGELIEKLKQFDQDKYVDVDQCFNVIGVEQRSNDYISLIVDGDLEDQAGDNDD